MSIEWQFASQHAQETIDECSSTGSQHQHVNNHVEKKRTHFTLGLKGLLIKDSDSASWHKERQLSVRTKLANIVPEEGPDRNTEHAKLNDSVKSKNDQLKRCLDGRAYQSQFGWKYR
ncbi:hypothetical protein IEQ34_005055 [Dendrobium chrysotoxum]|uniref:Uncharacterized protein n=1 Tax=Dendrobium chrysotoxum TaxID=161865 RepID=A0AAV7H7H9_DENCH|nr:hypothetical protein IEQ34_005055 [Dendrobium chrysotoxum]